MRQVKPHVLQAEIRQPNFLGLVHQFLHNQLHPTVSDASSDDTPFMALPNIQGRMAIYTSAVSMFYAPSDLSGVGGMRRERIHAVPLWRKSYSRYNCVFVNTDPTAEGMRGLDVARVRLFFSFKAAGKLYPCALVHWYSCIGDEPDEETCMWKVEPDFNVDGSPLLAVIHLDTVVRATHLIGVYGDEFIPKGITFGLSLDVFRAYYVNKYIDHHAFEIVY